MPHVSGRPPAEQPQQVDDVAGATCKHFFAQKPLLSSGPLFALTYLLVVANFTL